MLLSPAIVGVPSITNFLVWWKLLPRSVKSFVGCASLLVLSRCHLSHSAPWATRTALSESVATDRGQPTYILQCRRFTKCLGRRCSGGIRSRNTSIRLKHV